MQQQQIIEKTKDFVKTALAKAEAGHDWRHAYPVWKLARHIAQNENSGLFVVQLGALLHDIADAKFHDGDETAGLLKARTFLTSQYVNKDVITHIGNVIANISFGGGNHPRRFRSPELDVIRDADRLDAIGAIGIARAFNYGGCKNRTLCDPAIPADPNMTKEACRKSTAPTLNHFYEKLQLLKDRMNTAAGKKLAARRHQFMLAYSDEFYKEWDGEL